MSREDDMGTLATIISVLLARLADHERRIVALERPAPAGPPAVLSGSPQIKR